jgi:iron(III) transport system permease protein
MAVETLEFRATDSWFARLKTGNPWHWALLVLMALLVGLPAVFLVLGSLSQTQVPTDISLSALNFDNYISVWSDPVTYGLFYNTFIYVFGATALGISLAATLAWLVERTDCPGKIWIYAGVPMTLAMPGMLQAMAWVLLLSPRIGFLNTFLIEQLGLPMEPINIYSLGGMIFVEGLRLVPTAFLMLVPLMRSMDPSLEEAAAMSGAGPSSTLRKVTMRLLLPGLVAIVIYQFITALEVFEVPGILGMPADIFVFSTKIYQIHHSATVLPEYGKANALAMIYLVVAVVATIAYSRVIAHQERYTIVTGKGYRPRTQPLGFWRWPAIALVFLFLLFSILLPLLVFIYVSLLPFVQAPSMEAFSNLTLQHYLNLGEDPFLIQAIWNTILLIVLTSTGTVLLAFLVSLVVVRSKFIGRRFLDQLAFMPHAIPGIVLGLAFLWVYLQGANFGFDIFGSIWSICIAFIVSYIAYGTRAMNAAILQIHKDLEEAAHVSGAPHWRTMWRVFYPLMLPTFVGVWVWVMLHVVRSASLPLILYEGPENQVLAVIIWNMWDEGEMQAVGAIGVLMIVLLLLITVGVRSFGFGSSRHIQTAQGH